MPEETREPEETSILHRPISSRAMQIILVLGILALAIFIVITPVTCGQHGHPRWVQDLANIRQAILGITAYAVDHDGQFPSHIHLAKAYWPDDAYLYSPLDDPESLVFDETVQPGWYPYGSYWFLSSESLTYDADNPAAIMLAYREPRPSHDAYVIGFMDGHVETLTREAFAERMDQQADLIGSGTK